MYKKIYFKYKEAKNELVVFENKIKGTSSFTVEL